MCVEQKDLVEEALGALPPTGLDKKMDINEARTFFASFVKKHDSHLMTLLKTAEEFAVRKVAPSVESDLEDAGMGQGGNGITDSKEKTSREV